MAYIRKTYTPFDTSAPWPLKQVDNFVHKLKDALLRPQIGCNYRYLCVKSLPDCTDKLFIADDNGTVVDYALLTDDAFNELCDRLSDIYGLDYDYYSALSRNARELSYFEDSEVKAAERAELHREARYWEIYGN